MLLDRLLFENRTKCTQVINCKDRITIILWKKTIHKKITDLNSKNTDDNSMIIKQSLIKINTQVVIYMIANVISQHSVAIPLNEVLITCPQPSQLRDRQLYFQI